MTSGPHHRPVFTDRGEGWSHRHESRCACGGWVGIPVRSEAKAKRQYRQHVRAEATRAARARRRGRGPTPGALTRAADLPEQLR